MGADRALHVEVSGSEYEGLLPLGVAKILATLVQKEEANLVILGKQVTTEDAITSFPGLMRWGIGMRLYNSYMVENSLIKNAECPPLYCTLMTWLYESPTSTNIRKLIGWSPQCAALSVPLPLHSPPPGH